MTVAILTLLVAVAGVQADTANVASTSIRSPSYAPDGRLAFESNGDLWILPAGWETTGDTMLGDAIRITSGPGWDRHPTWARDGGAIVFSSDRDGPPGLWQIEIGTDGAVAAPRRLTDSGERDTQPTVDPEGAIVFVRGSSAAADLWILPPGGEARRLTDRPGAELDPAVSPDGSEVVYVSVVDGRRQLRRLRRDDPEADSVVLTGSNVALPTWSPSGDLIAYTTLAGRRAVWVTSPTGTFTNLVQEGSAAVAWAPRGDVLVLTAVPRLGPSYNGDPMRLPDRERGDIAPGLGTLQLVDAPRPPRPTRPAIALALPQDRSELNARAFDTVWNRLRRLYYDDNESEWERIRTRLRPDAVSAANDEALDRVIHAALQARPTIRPEVRGRAAVSSAHPEATKAGVDILRRGGNVVDAAVAVSFALGVVEPDASGIGGYGEMVLSLEGMDEPVVIEFLTRVPEHATLSNASLLEGGRLPPDGPVLANVPGTVAGMHKAWERYGSGNVMWSDLIAPAIRLAADGWVLDDAFTTTLDLERTRFLKYESSRALFFPEGQPLQPGDTLRNPDLAWTLGQIAEHGAEAFYRGDIAARMVADLRGHGNAMTAEDLAHYYAVERDPVRGTYRGHTIYSGAPAVSGGATLVAKLHLLENLDGPSLYRDDARTLHGMIEAWKLMPSSRGRIADPSLWPVNLEPFESQDSARVRWERCFDSGRSSGPADLRREEDGEPACALIEVARAWGEDIFSCEDAADGCRATGTTAFAVADKDGNMVAVTQTLGTWGGNFYVSPGLGFLYNDKLGSYGSNPADYNSRVPFARNTTSIAPTLVFRGTGPEAEPYLAVGAAGNAWISSAVYQVISGVIDGGLGPQRALELPRFLVGVRPDPRDRSTISEITVQIEDGFSPDVLDTLEQMGHRLQRISLRGELRMGYGAAVLLEDGTVRAGADPRRSGAAGAW